MKNILKLFMVCLLVFACKPEEKEKSNFAVIKQDGTSIEYTLDKAVEPEELMKGLMLVDSLPENKGMIFDLSGYPNSSMWMKDTLIPLDMIFANDEGEVVWIYENAAPMSEDLITPPVEFSYVIELNGGQVTKNGFLVGDKLKHEFFNNNEQ